MSRNQHVISDNTRASLNLLFNISRELATLTDLSGMLSRVLSTSMQSVNAERGSLVVVDASGQPVDAAIMVGEELIVKTLQQLQAIFENGLAGWAAKNRAAALVADTSLDARWMRRPDDDSEKSGAKSALCVPLLARDQLVGVLTLVHPQPGYFNADHLALLQSIADIAGIAVYNALLFDSLNAARRRYHDLFENSIDPIIITDLRGIIQECNRQMACVTGFTCESLQGKPLHDLLDSPPTLPGQPLDESLRFEAQLCVQSGAPIPVHVLAHRLELEEGARIQWIARDISAEKNLDALREDLTSMIYHDLRSPLSNVISSLEMLSSMLSEKHLAALEPVVQIAMRSTQRVQRLIASLLDIRRLEAGQPITTRQLVLVPDMLVEVTEMLAPTLQAKQQKLLIEMEGEAPILSIDADMIRRVLINLVENGSKFSPHRGVLAVGTRLEGAYLRFWVRDSGMGVSPDVQEKIFDKFTTLPPSGSLGAGIPRGLGLGLAFCRLAVQAHGGRIWVESLEGQGSTFTFTLPVTAPDGNA